MATSYGTMSSTVVDGLVIYYDALNPKSYLGQGNTWTNFVDGKYPLSKKGSQSPTFPQYNADGWFGFTGGASTLNYSRFDAHNVRGFTSMSIEAWWRIQVTAAALGDGAYQSVYGSAGPDSNLYGWQSYGIMIIPNEKNISYTFNTTGSGNPQIVANNYNSDHNIVKGKWHHTIATFDYTTQTVRAYFDGRLKASTTGSTASLNGISGGSLRIGVRSDIQGYSFFGDIAVIKIYERALSVQEVEKNYNALRRRFGV